jgi:hypothetical protein
MDISIIRLFSRVEVYIIAFKEQVFLPAFFVLVLTDGLAIFSIST